jgi:ATP-dependent Zn protease
MSYDRERQYRRHRTAKHEAGHALILLELGLPFLNVEILPKELTVSTPHLGYVLDRGELVAGVCRLDLLGWMRQRSEINGRQGCEMTLEDRVMQAMAGAAGEMIDNDPDFASYDWKESGMGDMADAKRDAKFVYREKSAQWIRHRILKPQFDRAVRFIRRHRKLHRMLTNALMEKSLLTYEECAAIWITYDDMVRRAQ